MSFGIIRMQKIKAGGVRGIQSHDRRERDPRTNPDIDKARSPDNYALVECEAFNRAVKERLESLESDKAVRKDAVVVCQLLVTSDSDFFKNLTPAREIAFFNQSLEFIAARYGRENIVSATVHKDEKTPHMHVNLTPIRDGRLVANEIFDRKELRNMHTEFHRSVGQNWGLERGESREEKRKHLDTEAYKHKTQLEAMRKELGQAKAELSQTKAELTKAKDEISTFRGVQEGTARVLAQAQTWCIQKGQEAEKAEKARKAALAEEKARADAEKAKEPRQQSRGPSMGMSR